MDRNNQNMSGVTTIERYNLKIAKINPTKISDFLGLGTYDALLIEYISDSFLIDFIEKFLQLTSLDINVALKPRLLLGAPNTQNSFTAYFDGVIASLAELESKIYSLSEINNNLNNLKIAEFSNQTQIKIGLIDPDPLFLNNFKNQLKNHPDFTTVWSTDSEEEALDKILLAQPKVDAIIGNIDTVKGSEKDILKMINKAGIQNIILLSDQEEDFEKAFIYSFKYGVIDYIKKPVQDDDIKRVHDRLITRLKRTELADSNKEELFLQKVFAFLYSRPIKQLKPIANRFSTIGYSYSMFSSLNRAHIFEDQLNLVHKAAISGYLREKFDEVVYLCTECSESALQFRETCPDCQSSHLKQEDLFHHFRCAYVGPRSDFQSSDDKYDLVCPKCDSRLKHIGVDYDKPAVVYDCLNCHKVFQDPIISAKCLNCGHENKSENLIRKEIYSYELTAKGIEYIKGNISLNLNDAIDESPQQIYFFRLLINEISRQKESEYKSCLAGLNFTGLSDIYDNLEYQKSQHLKQEIYSIIRYELPDSAEINYTNPTNPLIIFPNRKIHQSEQILGKIEKALLRLFYTQFPQNQLDIKYKVTLINEKETAHEHLEKLEKKLNA